MKFNLLERVLYTTDERDKFNSISNVYTYVSDQAFENFNLNYNTYTSIDDVVEKVYDVGLATINMIIEATIQLLIKQKIYSVDYDIFVEKYCAPIIGIWEDNYNHILDKYLEIIEQEVGEEAYRTMRKELRGRWIGGGFGVKGALSGAIQSSTMNFATGAAHDIVNMWGRAKTNTKITKLKQDLFNNRETRYVLAKGLYDALHHIQFAYMACLQEYNGELFDFPSSTEKEEAIVILRNIKRAKLPEDEKKDIIIKLLELDPFLEDTYAFALKSFGDPLGELTQIAVFFNINIEIYKLSLFQVDFINEKEYNSLNEANEKKLEMCEYLELLSPTKETVSEALIDINRAICEWEIKDRTYQDIIFETYEMVEQAKKDYIKIEEMIESININNKQDILTTIEKITLLDADERIKSLKLILLNEYLAKSEVDSRTVDGVEYTTLEDADKKRKENQSIDNFLNEFDLSNEAEYKQAVIKLNNLEIREKLTSETIKFLEEKLASIDIQNKHVDNLLFSTWHDAKSAREEKHIYGETLNDLKSYQDIIDARLKIDNLNLSIATKNSLTQYLDENAKMKIKEFKSVSKVILVISAVALVLMAGAINGSGLIINIIFILINLFFISTAVHSCREVFSECKRLNVDIYDMILFIILNAAGFCLVVKVLLDKIF